jgi:uncharacterized membrane protein YfcA
VTYQEEKTTKKSSGKQNVSLRTRAFVAIVLVLASFLGSLGLTLYVDQEFVWLLLIITIVGGIYTLTLRCPICGNPMYKRRIQIWNMEFTYWGGFRIPKNCSRCKAKF